MVVAIAGKFDPIHNGHIEHIKEAAKLGDYLVIITHPDDIVAKSSKKGYCSLSWEYRRLFLYSILKENNITGIIILDNNPDCSVVNILKTISPDIFAKGGDRNPNENPIPQSEIDICNQIGCKIVYNIGRQLYHSSEIAKENKVG